MDAQYLKFPFRGWHLIQNPNCNGGRSLRLFRKRDEFLVIRLRTRSIRKRQRFGNLGTPVNTKSCSTLFRIVDLSAGEFLPEMKVTIESGANSASGRLLGKFRLRYTTDDLTATVDPRLDAMALLRDVYSNQPDNYRLLLAMSLMSSRDTTVSSTFFEKFCGVCGCATTSKHQQLGDIRKRNARPTSCPR